MVAEADWHALVAINDYIIDRVSYDTERAESLRIEGVQTPGETLRRRRGICMDYAALFEHLARARGYRVMSAASDRLNHAWNTIELAGRTWIVDVTWNAGGILSTGDPIPAQVRADPDFRVRYLLTTPDQERRLAVAGLLSMTHEAPDITPIDFERTIDAMAVARQMRAATKRHNALVTAHNHAVDDYNAHLRDIAATEALCRDATIPAGRRRLLDSRLQVLRRRRDDALAKRDRYAGELHTSQAALDTWRARFRQIEAHHPLGVSLGG